MVPSRRTLYRPGAGAPAGTAPVAAGSLTARRVAGTQQAMCRGGSQHFAGIWEVGGAPSARKDAVRASFVKTGKGRVPPPTKPFDAPCE